MSVEEDSPEQEMGEQAGTTEVQKSVQTGMVGWFCSWLERVWGEGD